MPLNHRVADPDALRSSMESFVDEYQTVRLLLALFGLALIGVYVLLGHHEPILLTSSLVLLVVGVHALWCRLHHIRAPRMMLALDLTLWGSFMLSPGESVEITTASLAFLVLLVILFSDGRWMLSFLAYITGWYVASFIIEEGLSGRSIRTFMPIMVTVGALAVVVYRVRLWLGRLDANRSQMLGTVSHELRNNLTGMMGTTALVTSGEDLSPEEAQELLVMAHQQAVDASEIVEDLLTVSRIERSALTVASESVDVNEQVAVTARRFGEETEVRLSMEEGLPAVVGDALRIRQVLRNLLSNAVRYGGSSIEVMTRRQPGDRVQVIVADDGEGVPPEDEGTIFLPYRRSANSRRSESSIGLGLWICRQLAHAMGGALDYRRVEGRTEFCLTLRAKGGDVAGSGKGSRESQLTLARPSPVSDSQLLRAVAR